MLLFLLFDKVGHETSRITSNLSSSTYFVLSCYRRGVQAFIMEESWCIGSGIIRFKILAGIAKSIPYRCNAQAGKLDCAIDLIDIVTT
jgi:hypothetical protein